MRYIFTWPDGGRTLMLLPQLCLVSDLCLSRPMPNLTEDWPPHVVDLLTSFTVPQPTHDVYQTGPFLQTLTCDYSCRFLMCSFQTSGYSQANNEPLQDGSVWLRIWYVRLASLAWINLICRLKLLWHGLKWPLKAVWEDTSVPFGAFLSNVSTVFKHWDLQGQKRRLATIAFATISEWTASRWLPNLNASEYTVDRY